MAAQLLAQLQQQNPALIRNLVDAQQQYQSPNHQQQNRMDIFPPIDQTQPSDHSLNGSTSATAIQIPSPPKGGQQQSVLNRRSLVGRRSSTGGGISSREKPAEGEAVQRQNSVEWVGENGSCGNSDTTTTNAVREKSGEPIWVMR